ncbi:MAG: sigma-E processing peptidase SpoIIGA, partial [Oscillospiraceae bacterium]|nr:sigma-E processing peptidase SpoIIGA [Oscillospiraceae bacterium]
MKCIYLDVLIVLNIYVNYFLIKGTGKLTHTPVKTLRCAISSFVGSFFSLTIFLPETGALLN